MSFWTKARTVLRDVARLRPLVRMFVKDKTVVGKVVETAEKADKSLTPNP